MNAPAEIQAPTARAAQKAAHEANKLEKRCWPDRTGDRDFNMIEAGDKVMVCLSGGKDSYSLLDVLLTLRSRAPIDFEIVAVNLDQKQPGFPAHVLPDYLGSSACRSTSRRRTPTRSSTRVIPAGKTMCSLCSRLRRGILYRVASELGATKIALGHHRDDIVATLFLNMFYGGKLKGMPPKLVPTTDATSSSAPRLCEGSRPRALRAGEAVPIIPATCAVRRRTCSGRR